MTDNTKRFHIGDVLSITTGCLLSLNGLGGVYDILNFMTGEDLMTHQLGRGAEVCKPELLRQFPELTDIQVPKLNEHTFRDWLAAAARDYNEYYDVAPLQPHEPQFDNPIADAVKMMGDRDRGSVVDENGDIRQDNLN